MGRVLLGEWFAGVTRQRGIKLRRSLRSPKTTDPSASSVYLAPGSHVNAAREQCPAPPNKLGLGRRMAVGSAASWFNVWSLISSLIQYTPAMHRLIIS